MRKGYKDIEKDHQAGITHTYDPEADLGVS
jgi:hypothetical protein